MSRRLRGMRSRIASRNAFAWVALGHRFVIRSVSSRYETLASACADRSQTGSHPPGRRIGGPGNYRRALHRWHDRPMDHAPAPVGAHQRARGEHPGPLSRGCTWHAARPTPGTLNGGGRAPASSQGFARCRHRRGARTMIAIPPRPAPRAASGKSTRALRHRVETAAPGRHRSGGTWEQARKDTWQS